MVQGRFFDRFLDRLENHGSLNPGRALWVSFRTDRSRVHIPAGSFCWNIREPHHTLVTTHHNPREGELISKPRASVWNGGWNLLPSWKLESGTHSGSTMEHWIHFQASYYTHTAIPIMDDIYPPVLSVYSRFLCLWSGSQLQPRSSSRDKMRGRMHPMGTFPGRKGL
jgi:hypothetical protein